METNRVNSAQTARDVKDVAKHILYIPWFTGETTGGGVVIINSKFQNYTWQCFLLSYGIIEPL
jgi:hypothetical protein